MSSSQESKQDVRIEVKSTAVCPVAVELPRLKDTKSFAENPSDEAARHIEENMEKGFQMSPATLTFRNLIYKRGGKHLLKGAVSGYVKPGMMVCVLGGPDSGKSTLFDILAHRYDAGSLSGELLVDGSPPSNTFSQQIGLIKRDDVHLPTITVRETLEFSAQLRNQEHMPEEFKKRRVDMALKILGMQHIADNIVGNAKIRGVSGGEQRRLSVGIEGVSGKSIILADEPTNGLDSNSAYEVMKCFRRITDTGMGVMTSLVQPSPELFELFDTVMVMSRRACIYFGPRSQVMSYFESIGYRKPPQKSVSDFLETISGNPKLFLDPTRTTTLQTTDEASDVEIPEVNKRSSLADIHTRAVRLYRCSELYSAVGKVLWHEVDSDPARAHKDGTFEDIDEGNRYATTLLTQVKGCVKRQFFVTFRNHQLTAMRMGMHIFVGIMIGTLFLDLGTDSSDALTRLGMIFFAMAFTAFSVLGIVPVLFDQKSVYKRQLASGFFRPVAFQSSLLATEIPQSFIESLVFTMIVYGMTGLEGGIGSSNYLYFLFQIYGLKLTTWTFCLLCAAAAPKDLVAQAAAPVMLAFFFIFSGFLVSKENIPGGWIWAYYLSLFTASFKGLVLNEFDALSIQNCFGPGVSCSGQQYLQFFDLHDNDGDRWGYFWQIFIFFLAYQFCTTLALTFLNDESPSSPVPLKKDSLLEHERTQLKRTVSQIYSIKEQERKDDESHTKMTDRVREMTSQRVKGMYLTFDDLKYTVQVPKEGATMVDKIGGNATVDRVLLNGISAFCEPGKMVALMGASGAGKSTLLDVLAGRKTGGKIEGTIKVDGRDVDEFFIRRSGYVEQRDSHVPTSSVREAVTFSAMLRLPETMSVEDKLRRVEDILTQLELKDVEDEVIGEAGDPGSLAPDLRKKVTIAVEVVNDPSLLFLDEPTTSLGTAGALNVMTTVHDLAHTQGRSVICTIHQPSAEVFNMFDWILLLQKGGRVAYFGPVAHMSDYFQSVGLPACPEDKNPADYALDMVNYMYERTKSGGVDGAGTFDASPVSKERLDDLKDINDSLSSMDSMATNAAFDSEYATSSWIQYRVCLVRWWQYFSRRKIFTAIRLLAGFFLGFVEGSLWYQMDTDSQSGGFNRISIMFMSILYASFFATLAIPGIMGERAVHFREKTSNTYRLFPYFISRIHAESIFFVIQTFLFVTPMYWLSGLRDDDSGANYLTFLVGFWFITTTSAAFSELMASISPDADLANVIATGFLSIFMLFAGFLAPRDTMPEGWKWANTISYFRYSLNFFVQNEANGFAETSPTVSLMKSYNLDSPGGVWENLGYLVIFYFVFRGLTLLSLRFIEHIKR